MTNEKWETKNEKMEIAKEILNQLGGNKFIAMTGARAFIAVEDKGLMFRLPKALGGINKIVITLDWTDTYTVIFYNVCKFDFIKVSKHTGIYADNLSDLISNKTGLAVRL